MNALVIALCVFAQCDLPGGVVYPEGKNLVYQEMKSGKRAELLDQFPFVCEGPVAVSDDLSVMAFSVMAGKGNNLYIQRLPGGKPFLLHQAREKLESICISPDSHMVAYSTISGSAGVIAICQNPGLPGYNRVFTEMHFPVFTRKKTSIINGETWIKALGQHFTEADPIVAYYKLKADDSRIVGRRSWSTSVAVMNGSIWNRQKSASPLEIRNRGWYFEIRPDNEGDIILAMVSFSERTRKWGPIGIQYLASSPIGGARTWTVPVQADFLKPTSDFKGAAKKPDGTITCIANRSMITETGQVFAKDILGSNPAWPNNSQFLFWHNQAVWMCDGNSPKQLFPLTPSYFCYAKDSPARTSGRSTLFQDKQFFVNFGDFCFEFTHTSTKADVYSYLLGLLKENPSITWLKEEHFARFNRKNKFISAIVIRDGTRGSVRPNIATEWCVTDKTKLEDISDPSTFKLQRTPGIFEFVPDEKLVILLRRGSSYLGMIILYNSYEIKPVGKHYYLGVLPDEKGRYNILSAPTSDHAVFICDWKYWSQTPK